MKILLFFGLIYTVHGFLTVQWLPGMRLGQGYDSVKGRVRGMAADLGASDLTIMESHAQSQKSSAEVSRVENTKQLKKSLEVSADASMSYGLFSGTASSTFMKNTEVNAYSVYFMVKSKVINSEFLANRYVIDKTAANLNQKTFFRKYGDHYVQGYITGGEFFALLDMQTNDNSEKTSVGASLGAKYGPSFSLSTKFKRDVQDYAKNHQVKIRTLRIGGWGDSLPLEGIDEIYQAAKDLPKIVAKNGEPMFAILQPYETLPGVSVGGIPGVDVNAVNAIKETLAGVYLRAKYILDSVNYALRNSKIAGKQKMNLENVQQQMVSVMSEVIAARRQIDVDPSKAPKIPRLPSLSLIPKRLVSGQRIEISPPTDLNVAVMTDKLAYVKKTIQATRGSFRTKAEEVFQFTTGSIGQNYARLSSFIRGTLQALTRLSVYRTDRQRQSMVRLLTAQAQYGKTQASKAVVQQKHKMDELKRLVKNMKNDKAADTKAFKEFENAMKYYWAPAFTSYGSEAYWEALKKAITIISASSRSWTSEDNPSDFIDIRRSLWESARSDLEIAKNKLYRMV